MELDVCPFDPYLRIQVVDPLLQDCIDPVVPIAGTRSARRSVRFVPLTTQKRTGMSIRPGAQPPSSRPAVANAGRLRMATAARRFISTRATDLQSAAHRSRSHRTESLDDHVLYP